jgi:2-oxoglutarate ferredoxin oxidoreductase subunit beta
VNDEGVSVDDLWIHDEHDKTKAHIIASFFDTAYEGVDFPRPFGVIYTENRSTYESALQEQIDELLARKGRPSLDKILSGDKTWTIL